MDYTAAMEFLIILWLGYVVYLATRPTVKQQGHLLLLWGVLLLGLVVGLAGTLLH